MKSNLPPPGANRPIKYLSEFYRVLSRPFWQYILAGTATFTYFGWIQLSVGQLAGNDGYYHLRMASLLLRNGFLPFSFPYMPMSILAETEFADHHYLFHAAIAPFLILGDELVMGKIAAATFAATVGVTFFFLLRQYEVRWPWLWLILLGAASQPFLYRMSMLRAQSLGAVLLVLAIWLTLRRARWGLFVLGFVFAWMYMAYPIVGAVVVLAVIAEWLANRRWLVGPVVFTAAGTLAGTLTHPYGFNYVIFVTRHLATKLVSDYPVRVGNEWYPFDTNDLLQHSWIALACFLAGLVAVDRSSERSRAMTYAMALVSIVMFVLLFKHRRFVEYWPLFSVLLAAFSFGTMSRVPRFRIRLPILVLVTVAGAYFALERGRETIGEMTSERGAAPIVEAGAWLMENTPPGERIFHADWDDFPMLFFGAPGNTFLSGLDPMFMYLKDSDRSESYGKVTQTGNRAVDVILEEFQSRFVFLTNDHGNLRNALDRDARASPIFLSGCCSVFELTQPESGESLP